MTNLSDVPMVIGTVDDAGTFTTGVMVLPQESLDVSLLTDPNAAAYAVRIAPGAASITGASLKWHEGPSNS
ncbi:hypothetical protein [Amycolatopsis sp. NPDC051372]|uniref:hypothetical protein n=1 Tax=Amycolatopsis sp. NPDC051372 TaxID=3155669 RepID=UPI003445F40B